MDALQGKTLFKWMDDLGVFPYATVMNLVNFEISWQRLVASRWTFSISPPGGPRRRRTSSATSGDRLASKISRIARKNWRIQILPYQKVPSHLDSKLKITTESQHLAACKTEPGTNSSHPHQKQISLSEVNCKIERSVSLVIKPKKQTDVFLSEISAD